MKIIERSIKSFNSWIREKTKGDKSVVELGAGFFNMLAQVSSSVEEKIGIELVQAYIDNAKYNDCIKIQGDATKYRDLLHKCQFETVMIIDFLEHLPMSQGKELINNLKEDFKKILLMIPCGLYDQKEDVTGYNAHDAQTHKSFWYEEDILTLGFQENIIDRNYHIGNPLAKHDVACAFCVWRSDLNV